MSIKYEIQPIKNSQGTGEEAGHTWIDLELPNGVKWASTNIGATRSQDAGNYYAWAKMLMC